MEPDAEQQQDDTDLGQLVGDVLICPNRGGEADDDARHQIAHERRQLDAMGKETKAKRKHQTNRQCRNERRHVKHCRRPQLSGLFSEDTGRIASQ